MKQEALDEILRLHKLWLEGKDGGKRADLAGANLRRADLAGANLYGANLSKADLFGATLKGANLEGATLKGAGLAGANLQGANLSRANIFGAGLECANLRGADLDLASWPLWCGSLSVKIDARIAAQLAYHVVRACQSVKDDEDVVAFCNDPVVIKLANRFHRVDECGRIEASEGGAK